MNLGHIELQRTIQVSIFYTEKAHEEGVQKWPQALHVIKNL